MSDTTRNEANDAAAGGAVGVDVDWRAIEDRHELGLYAKRELTLVRGEGAIVYDAAGNDYIDCVTGVGVAFVGHAHPRVTDAIAAQSRRLMTAYEIFYHETRARFLERLARFMPAGLDRFFLCNSGTEAVEGAIKFARLATGRSRIVAAKKGYHGKTLGALSATWDPAYRKPVEPLVPDVVHAAYGDVDAFCEAIDERTAAVLLEPIQGEGGIREGDPDFLRAVARRAADVGALFVADEVQTGGGRTGSFLAITEADVVPDIVTLAKAIGGGLPLGAVACGAAVRDLPARVHSSTFGGNPLACAAGLATLEAIEADGLIERAAALGARFRARIEANQPRIIREVRGRGLMIGLDLRQKAGRYLRPLTERGVLALLAGNTVLRFLPPAVITEDEIDRVADAVLEVLA